ncbi:copper chaperone CopZ [Jeotgalibacillus malaysiensis]|uniref:Copper chaperone CopZ n=1 Tax=Jeotgalibacillus malaysiensis TaxID=1508404 RepID=A0A0B5AHK7_9BACL|nr:copper ion binding protein [Jeotgalibacillus malaysiensis]AJD89561.1 copper chaperone CopZ [Jeotgalibacillus malaysiensis]
MESVSLKVTGMSCQNCVKSIEKNLGKMQGVEKVSVSLQENIVNVNYNEDEVSLDQMQVVIEDQGYEVNK